MEANLGKEGLENNEYRTPFGISNIEHRTPNIEVIEGRRLE